MNVTEYWNAAALDPQVDDKYICDIQTSICKQDLPEMSGQILEIGCGVGRLMQDSPDWFGVDISANMLEIARRRKPNCNFVLVNGDIPFKVNTFDHVYSYLLFQHLKLEHIHRYIVAAHRVLKEGGQFTFQFIRGTEAEPLSNHYELGTIFGILSKAGFGYSVAKPSLAHEQWTIVVAHKEL